MMRRALAWTTCFAAFVGGVPALATIKDGVDAWSRGDYAAAVEEWRSPAAAGDPDALFNMGQAYRLGRGVPADPQRAEDLYERAAAAGHLQAADTYGLMLFQDGRREEALPFVQDAARRGDPRSRYLLGIARFNGDLVERDWVRAYALLTLAGGAGLPQAAPALAEMDRHIPLEQRQQAAALAETMEAEATAARSRRMAAADLAVDDGVGPDEAVAAPAVAETAATSGPGQIETTWAEPSVADAGDAVAQAREADGTGDPAKAGASFASADAPEETVAEASMPPANPASARAGGAGAQESVRAPDGVWRVQLGAFSVDGNAARLWDRLSSRPELAGKRRELVSTGSLTKLQAAGYASREEAQEACRSLAAAGQDCLVTRD